MNCLLGVQWQPVFVAGKRPPTESIWPTVLARVVALPGRLLIASRRSTDHDGFGEHRVSVVSLGFLPLIADFLNQ